MEIKNIHQNNTLQWYNCQDARLLNCPIFDIHTVTRKTADNKCCANFFYLNAKHWVIIVPILDKHTSLEKFLMVRQFRHGDALIYTEFPAGIINDNENPLEAAKRELTEETGYISQNWTLIGKANPNPAIMNNTVYTYMANDLLLLKKNPKRDPSERLETIILDAKSLKSHMGQSQEFSHALMIQAYYLFLHYCENTN